MCEGGGGRGGMWEATAKQATGAAPEQAQRLISGAAPWYLSSSDEMAAVRRDQSSWPGPSGSGTAARRRSLVLSGISS